MDHENHVNEATWLTPGQWGTALLLVVVLLAYVAATVLLRRRGTAWSIARTGSWVAGLLCAGVALIGPLAERAHLDFTVHMLGHVLLGMLGPLLLVLAAPVTLALRVLPVHAARPLGKLLSSSPLAVLTNPFVAGALNIGGLWVLYRTGMYSTMHSATWVHVLVHAHVLIAGYLFTFAVLGGPDPAPHRFSPPWRALALVLAIAAHNILAKTLYGYPPEGVPAEQARSGAELMYYAGAPVEIALISLTCWSWLLKGRPEPRATPLEPYTGFTKSHAG